MLLAFLAHTLLDLYDPRYQQVRDNLSSRRTFFEHLPALAFYLPFDTWEYLFDSMIDAPYSPRNHPHVAAPAKGRGKFGIAGSGWATSLACGAVATQPFWLSLLGASASLRK